MTNPNPAQARRKDLESLAVWAKEIGADPRSLILLAMDVEKQCDVGIISEKVCVRSDTGIVEVIERFPAVRLQALAFIHKVLQDAQKELDKMPPPDTEINLFIGRKRLEDALEESDDLTI